MGLFSALLGDRRAAAAAELAMVLPLLLMLMFSGMEAGNYFMNEHTLVKAVRNGARFAARQNFTNYPTCSGSPGGTVVADTQRVVINGYLSGGTMITPNIEASDITVTTGCDNDVVSQEMKGIYFGRVEAGVPKGAQVVTVQATVDYRPVVGLLGFDSVGLRLNASSQAAVAGI